MMKRIRALDYLKTLGIIGVLLYHIGILKNGYWGVEIFFVVGGYLMMRGISRSIREDSFHPVKYCLKRIASFWPLIAAAGLLLLAVGYFCMLPDDYENLAESVIASNLFSNNILQAITTRNYWDIVNTYKPLMHTWYLGVLVQATIFLSVILWAASKASKKNGAGIALILLTAVSFIAWCLPVFSDSDKFYHFPFRLFEITVGCLIFCLPKGGLSKKARILLGIPGYLLLLFCLFSGVAIPGWAGLLTATASSALVLWSHGNLDADSGFGEKAYKLITLPGRYSFDIYIWHQIVIALLYYAVFQKLNALLVCLTVALTAALSLVSITIRKKAVFLRGTRKRLVFAAIAAVIGCALSGFLYLNAGVVRDVPELGIDKANVHRNMHAEYVDVPFSWDVDFSDAQKTHVLILGDSFGRDFANVLNESAYAEQLEISYIYGADTTKEKDRVEQADYIFYGGSTDRLPKALEEIPGEKLYIVGNKSYGNSNGIIYINRGKDWYYDQRVALDQEMLLQNDARREAFGDHYIDMISPLLDKDGQIRVFTDDGFFISQDCKHLTKQGAQYYARILDLRFLSR